MPQLEQKRGGSNGACPDATTVLAVIEGEADEWLRNAYAQHLAQCSACSELDSRLRNFDRPALADEAEWRQTEKRLDNWMNAFLDSRAAVPTVQPVEKRDARVGFWQSIWRPRAAWKISLATALLALVAVGVDVYLRLQPPVQPDQVKVTTGTAPVAESKAVLPPAENAQPKSEAPNSTEPQITAPAVPAAGGALYQHGPMAAAPKTSPAIKPEPKSEKTVTAANRAGPSEPQTQAALETPPTSQKPEIAASPPEPTAAAEATAQGRTFSVRPASSTSGGTQPSNTAKAPGSAPSTPRAAVPNPPASLHLASGARLWITLDSVNRQPDGAFTFSGSLLMRLSASGSSALDRGTEVSGSGTEAQGRTSLVISEIVVGGAHYKLKSRAGAGKVRTARSSSVVSFDSGKVLEVWLSSDSIYERSAAESSQ
ncbi:MAG TPA: hypothetical protein VES66_06325 [Terriglobales bacterium]|nr:hypothetical protein [Terriglobales bacterium]